MVMKQAKSQFYKNMITMSMMQLNFAQRLNIPED